MNFLSNFNKLKTSDKKVLKKSSAATGKVYSMDSGDPTSLEETRNEVDADLSNPSHPPQYAIFFDMYFGQL